VTEDTSQRLLRAAANLMGNGELATRLKVRPDDVEAWLGGKAAMPSKTLRDLSQVLVDWSDSLKSK
jgi:hypothetical protein